MNARRPPLHLALPVLIGLIALACTAGAQSPAPRIRGSIEATPSVPLRGSLNPHIRSAQDLGPLAPDTQIRGITLVFSRSPEQQAALDQLLASQIDPSSPLFHRWLTPAEFAARFGTASADIAAASTWLQSHGFTIDSQGADRITFSGTASQIQQAFATELHRFRSPATEARPAELHFAPTTEIALPASLAPVTSAILNLSDFRPRPTVHPRPQFTTAAGVHYLAPDDIFAMYDLSPLIGPGSAPLMNLASTVGQGQHIAIIGQTFVNTAPASGIYTFQTLLTRLNPIHMVIMPGTGPEAVFLGDEGESDLDLEYSSGIAQNATIFFVYTGSSPNYGVFDALSFAITQDIAPVISLSYGECEPLMSSTEAQQRNAVLQQAAAQGQTIVASSGDSGSTACAPFGLQSGLSTSQLIGSAVNFPADSPYVTAVGGTQMALGSFGSGATQYWAPASFIDNKDSLLSYVPETVWNESGAFTHTVASGGGVSTLFTRPVWQSGVTGIPAGSFRLLPDVSLQASTSNPGYIICSEDPSITGAQSDCSGASLQNSNGVDVIAGGTSFAAPLLAGSLALLNKYEHANGLGNINPVLYSLAARPSVYLSAFHDITTGTISGGCPGGSGDGIITCGLTGNPDPFAATTGYDQATGLGTLDFGNLAAAWPSTPATSLLASSTGFATNLDQVADGTAAAGTSVSLQVAVYSGSNGSGFVAPTGSVSLSLDGQLLNASVPLNASSPQNQLSLANVTFTAPATTGSHILLASYPGDATHAPSSGAYSLLVGNVTPAGNIALSAPNLSLSANGVGASPITISPSGGYNGYLNWTISMSGSVATTFCYLVDANPVDGITTATLHLGVGTACDSATPLTSRSTSQRSSLHPDPIPGRPAHPALTARVAAPILAVLLFGLFPRRRRSSFAFLAALLLSILPLTLAGCGGASSSASGGGASGGGGGSSSRSPTYTVTINAKDSVNTSITSSTVFTLTVK